MRTGAYPRAIVAIFRRHHRPGQTEVSFTRGDLEIATRVFNPGDLVYHYQHRAPLPDEITRTAPPNTEWVLVSKRKAEYAFVARPKG